jgi:hypothetical protein
MNTRVVIVTAMLAALSPDAVMAEEIRPTHGLVARARQQQQQQQQQPGQQINRGEYEYHFRRVGDNILFCAYYAGGNGGFCTKGGPKYVAQTDKAAVQFCK